MPFILPPIFLEMVSLYHQAKNGDWGLGMGK